MKYGLGKLYLENQDEDKVLFPNFLYSAVLTITVMVWIYKKNKENSF
jgi:hypothetical protein